MQFGHFELPPACASSNARAHQRLGQRLGQAEQRARLHGGRKREGALTGAVTVMVTVVVVPPDDVVVVVVVVGIVGTVE